MGVSEMCNLQSKVLSPPIFGSELQEEYKKILEMKRNGETVDYATKKYPSSKRLNALPPPHVLYLFLICELNS